MTNERAEQYHKLEIKLMNATKKLNRLCNRTMSCEEEGFQEMLKAERKVWDIEDEMKALLAS